ncbi:MAG: hypothetical protein J0I20_35820 [Chloroflexi bacterium]|nr:hypothetical protein [Chloroflexota bacterium]
MSKALGDSLLSACSPLIEPDESEVTQESETNPAKVYARKYWHDFRQWMLDCIVWKDDEGPTPYQLEMAETLIREKRLSGRGPHGLGKTSWNAWLILWFSTTRDAAETDWKIPTTAGAWRQLSRFLWPEVKKWAKRLRWDIIGREPFHPIFELQKLALSLKHGEAFAVASDNPELIEGAHADQLLYIFDESKAVPDATFDAAEGAFANTGANSRIEAFAVAMSTPGEPLGRFYDIQSKKPGLEDWAVRHVTFDEVVRAGRATWQWATQRKKLWGEDSALYQNKVLGKFASQDEQGIIPLAWVEAANERWNELKDNGQLLELGKRLDAVGVDVGEMGDETVMALRSGQVIIDIIHNSKQDTMATTGKVFSIISSRKGRAVVDVIGIGAGVVSRLRELTQTQDRYTSYNDEKGMGVVPFHAARASERMDSSGEMGFINLRAEAWWAMRERLDPANHSEVALPQDDKLTGDLVAPRYKVTSSGKYQVEAKADIKKRIGRSTDTGDAVIMAYWQEVTREYGMVSDEIAQELANYDGSGW